MEQGQKFETICVPLDFVPLVLHQSHNLLGHNGTPRMYAYVSQMFYWPGMHRDIVKHCRECVLCKQQNLRAQPYPAMHLYVPHMPLQLIAMDLIELPLMTSARNKFALTIMDMLTSFVWAIPIPNKQASTIIGAFMTHFYEKEGGCSWLLTDNGTEFKNEQFSTLCEGLGITHIFISPHHPQGNSKLEKVHDFLKNCLTKYLPFTSLEWDKVLSKAVFSYNIVPGSHSKESPYFLMKGRDPITPLHKILGPRIRYQGDNSGKLNLQDLVRTWTLAAYNIKLARAKQEKDFLQPPLGELAVGDSVLIKNHLRTNKLQPRFLAHFRIVKFHNDRKVEVISPTGKSYIRNLEDLHYQYPADSVIKCLPEAEAFGRSAKMVYHPHTIPSLEWKLTTNLHPYVQSMIKNKI